MLIGRWQKNDQHITESWVPKMVNCPCFSESIHLHSKKMDFANSLHKFHFHWMWLKWKQFLGWNLCECLLGSCHKCSMGLTNDTVAQCKFDWMWTGLKWSTMKHAWHTFPNRAPFPCGALCILLNNIGKMTKTFPSFSNLFFRSSCNWLLLCAGWHGFSHVSTIFPEDHHQELSLLLGQNVAWKSIWDIAKMASSQVD